MVDSHGAPTAALTALVVSTNIKHDKWKANNDNIRQKLVESLCENKQTKLIALEFQDLPTHEFYLALEKRLKEKADKAEQAQSEKMRKDQLERTMMQGAGVGRGVQSAPPSAPPSTPPSAEYGAKVRDAIRPHF